MYPGFNLSDPGWFRFMIFIIWDWFTISICRIIIFRWVNLKWMPVTFYQTVTVSQIFAFYFLKNMVKTHISKICWQSSRHQKSQRVICDILYRGRSEISGTWVWTWSLMTIISSAIHVTAQTRLGHWKNHVKSAILST